MNVQKILAATDFSSASQTAFELAAKLAVDYTAKLMIAHVKATPAVPGAEDDVYDPTDSVEKRKLDSMEPQVPSVIFQRHYLHGRPAEQLLYLANREGADMIVMGTHGETNAVGIPLGAVAAEVLSKATCQVVAVKQAVSPIASTPSFQANQTNLLERTN